jgi:hypothetical protein
MEAARENLAEKMDRIKQYWVLDRDDVGRGNKIEEGKNSNAKQRDGYGPGLLFLHKKLRWIGDLELAFQYALKECGEIKVTGAELYERITEGEEAQKKFRGLKKSQVNDHLHNWRILRIYQLPYHCLTKRKTGSPFNENVGVGHVIFPWGRCNPWLHLANQGWGWLNHCTSGLPDF